MHVKLRNILYLGGVVFSLVACNSPTSISNSTTNSTTTATSRFASGTRVVKINTSIPTQTSATTTSSFVSPTFRPAATPIPYLFPGYDGVSTYVPGISATTYYDVDGVSVIAQPSWLLDFQLGITSLPGGTGMCAAFGGTGNADAGGFYRVSENNCGNVPGGTGNATTDQVFARIILNRDVTLIGSAENLMMQIEYQAQSLRLNSDGVSLTNPESNLDQLWKIFWNSSLSSASAAYPFSIFVPPNYASCQPGGTEQLTSTPAVNNCVSGYTGAPVTVKQIMIPLSAYPTMSVIQLTRMAGRINNPALFLDGTPVNYVSSFLGTTGSPGYTGDADCENDSPLCLGLVIRSVMLMRI